jgi:DNA helicase-2/ATP-dependent DNA helicase PcrA
VRRVTKSGDLFPTQAEEALLAGLNPAQRAAVTHPGGPLLIVAGPGSGKTRVITRRVAWLVRARGVDPRRILAITFTNKAAREMRERVEQLLPGAGGAWISTFHAMGARILRREVEVLGGWTRDFTIYDTGDRQTVVKQAIQACGFDTARFRPAVVGGWISAWKNQGLGERPGEERDEDEDAALDTEVFRKVRAAYEGSMRRANALDFDDLLVKLLELFERHPGVRDAYAERFQHLLVDEYQDTNRVQYRLVRHLAARHGNVTVCGDPDQSIYAWRGADIRNILDFEQDYPGCKVVLLEQNYRSVNTVLRAAQAVIERNAQRKRKDLWSARGEGARIAVIEAQDEQDEAERIAERVQELLREGVRPCDVAVFYRVNFLQRALETALRLARVPYQVVAGLEFYDRREIRDLVAFAKLCVNPRDDVAFRRVVNVPQRGVGERSVELLAEFAADRRVSLAEAARSSEALARIRGRARAGLEGFTALLGRLAELSSAPAGAALRGILDLIDREAWLAEMVGEQEVDRDANVEELLAHADAWDEGAEERRKSGEQVRTGLAGFLEEIALVSDTDALEDENDRVSLMTLHAAKGLEFPVVFIAGCEEELLPHVRAIQSLEGPQPEAGLEEERRLFYVGITRAAERLHLSHAQSRRYFGDWSFRAPSRFLAEIPPALVEGPPAAEDEGDVLGAYEEPAAGPALAVGDRVEHDHFGPGTIETLQGSGVNARAVVRFPAYGTKTLLLQYAKLKLLGRAKR